MISLLFYLVSLFPYFLTHTDRKWVLFCFLFLFLTDTTSTVNVKGPTRRQTSGDLYNDNKQIKTIREKGQAYNDHQGQGQVQQVQVIKNEVLPEKERDLKLER